MTFVRPSLATLVDRIRDDLDGRLKGADSRVRRSVLDVLARIHGGATDGLYGYLDTIASWVMPDTADEEHLDRWATIWGVSRRSATSAVGAVTLAGTEGAVVPAGAVLLRADGARFDTVAAATIAGGQAVVTVSAEIAGLAGDTAAATVLAFASPVAGVAAAATVGADGLAGGTDDESDALLLQRLLARIQQPPQGGATSDYLAWALAQPEVTRAWIYPGWVGLGSVGVAVLMDGRADIFPLAADIAAITAALDLVRPVTANLVVFAPAPVAVDYRVRLTPDTPATRAAFEAERSDLFAREAAPGGTMLISHMREAISVAAGVTDYDLQAPLADVVAAAGTIPVPGAVVYV